MKVKFAWITAIVLSLFMISCVGQEAPTKKTDKKTNKTSRIQKLMHIISAKRCEREKIRSYPALRKMLEAPDTHMSPAVISKIVTSLKCAEKYHSTHNQILTVIDYS
ncbi:MAG: hypothetical protein QNK11_09965, partial [Legionella sp.]|nr:hypothetical protein [Legionella sp.]